MNKIPTTSSVASRLLARWQSSPSQPSQQAKPSDTSPCTLVWSEGQRLDQRERKNYALGLLIFCLSAAITISLIAWGIQEFS